MEKPGIMFPQGKNSDNYTKIKLLPMEKLKKVAGICIAVKC